jgi:signal transduction histidine kinase
MASAEVYRTGRSARLGAVDWSAYPGPVAEAGLRFGVISQVACPITVEGTVWGVVTLNAGVELPPDTEQRLEKFTELVTTAIANTEARVALRAAAEEQGALRHVATLVAASAAPSDVFAAVTHEVALVLGADATLLCRADPDGAAVVVGSWGDSTPRLGTRIPKGGTNLTTIVLDTGHPARIESYDDASGYGSEVARSHGLRSAVGAPVVVEGRVWGLVVAGTTGDEILAQDAEERLAAFTELVATAIANAESGEALATLADEQAALRRVATLVAKGAPPAELFSAVATEAGQLLGMAVGLCRYEENNTATTVGAHGSAALTVGSTWPLDESSLMTTVYRTARVARIDDYADLEGPAAEKARESGFGSTVGAPIIVRGSLWGVIVAISTSGEPIGEGAAVRLAKFTELVATAISNAAARDELIASRVRIVAAGDEARRRIERNLHDGTQQRLISLGFAVRAAEAGLPPERDDLRAQLSGVVTGLVEAIEDLQEISRGIHPAILSKGGLASALRALAHRSAIPVDLDIRAEGRIVEPIEVAAYFVASEALANAAKHSQASRIDVLLEQREDSLLLSIGDDGVGGADAARGSGLVGLIDRVEALGGSIRLTTRPGKGTKITAEFPRELELPQPVA